MKSRYVPYATTPGRLLAQLFSDVVVVIWTVVWVLVGLAVHTAVSTIAEVGRQVQGGADGVADSLKSAGHSADNIPLVGDAVSKPLTRGQQGRARYRRRRPQPGHHRELAGRGAGAGGRGASDARRGRCRGWCCASGSSGASGPWVALAATAGR